jgi:hypothetical protein
MTRVGARLSDERGWGLVSSILVLGILVSMALPLMSLVDSQQRQTTHERKSESSFNLAEAAFDAEVFVLSSDWPALSTNPYPPECTQSSADPRCPDAQMLARTYAGPDYSAPGWTVQVRDDVGGSDYYDAAVVDDPQRRAMWDMNGNAKMWVRADGHAAGRDRTVVALVRRQDRLEPFPRNAVTAGWFGTTTNGNKMIVDTQGPAAQPAPVAVRCTATTTPPSPGCLDYRPDRGQVSPDTSYTGYVGDTAVPEDALKRFETRAKALGTYVPSGCPQSPAGELVYVENGDCGYAGGGQANSADSPGMLIVERGSVTFSGSMTFYGLVYAANVQRATGSVVSIGGAATVRGSVAVDWGGGITVGANGDNLSYDDRVFPFLKSFGSAAAVQGTWRELPAT